LELKNILADIENPPDDHKFIGILLNRIGLEEGEILTLISDMLRLTPEWEELIRDIDNWFNERISENQG